MASDQLLWADHQESPDRDIYSCAGLEKINKNLGGRR